MCHSLQTPRPFQIFFFLTSVIIQENSNKELVYKTNTWFKATSSMPRKKSRSAAQQAQLAAVRHGSAFRSSDQLVTTMNPLDMLEDTGHEPLVAEEHIAELLSLLELEQASSQIFSEGLQLQHAHNAELSTQLDAEKAKSAEFLQCIAAEPDRYDTLYKKYHVERHAHQRSNKREEVLCAKNPSF
jgi:hypothetical protein